MENQQSESIEFSGVRVSSNYIQEFDDKKVRDSINRETISSIKLKNGIYSKHPLLQVLMGGGFTYIGYLFVKMLIEGYNNGGRIKFILLVAMLLTMPMGIWLILTSFRKGYYLKIKWDAGEKRFAFIKKPDFDKIKKFVVEMNSRFNCEVDMRDL